MRYIVTVLLAPAVFAVPVEWRVTDGGNGHFYELIGNYNDPAQSWDWA